ncbi:MAG: hypothetical protein B0D92_03755 [Spirochaeta sp. LUC14_002_19_P3]|nr:MAG: hypothetical protein B0D92_03755 [Spirochaeta sp. LUC14_002_19_P3]
MEQGGAKAHKAGQAQEQEIADILESLGYKLVPQNQFIALKYNEQPMYSRQFHIGKGIYDTDIKCDFILYHPGKYPECLIIESKNQNSAGSVDEKLPYLVHNINDRYTHKAIVIVDGEGFKKGAVSWIRLQASPNTNMIAVYNMKEFRKQASTGKF